MNKNLTEIERVSGFLDAIKLKEDWISDIQKNALVTEAHHSTHIEGTGLDFNQAKNILAGHKVLGVDPNDRRELLNYKKAMFFISKYLGKNDPITEEIICKLHEILVKGVRNDKSDPGNYRKIQNYLINSMTKNIVYTPPPPSKVPALMKELVKWLNKPGEMSPVLAAGISQFRLVHIHPFIDGNGRAARLLSTLVLYKTGYDFKKLFTLSEFYDRDRPSYYKAIQSVRNSRMDMTSWLEYFVSGLSSQMAEIRLKGEKIISSEEKMRTYRKMDLNERQIKALKQILINGKITINEHQNKNLCSRRTAQRDFEILEEKKIVKPVAQSATDPTKYYELL